MKRIFYSSGSIVTGDRMATAIMHYAEILSQSEDSDTIDVPITLESGEEGRAQVLLGPGSQLVVVPAESVDDAPEDDATIAELESRARTHSSPRPLASDDNESRQYGSEYNSDFSNSGLNGPD
jgi:hypothetical protein